MINIYKFLASIFLVVMLLGCSNKQAKLYNLTPEEWYSQILENIKSNELELADKYYVSMASEHVASPLLEQILMILSQAHANNEEYLLANFYLNEYVKRYGDNAEKTEFAEFLKIKANFDSFLQPNRNQKLIQDSINSIEKFLYLYPNTKFKPLAQTMLVKFKLAIYSLDKEIANLYIRTGRDISAEIYKEKLKQSPLNDAKILNPERPWYRRIFN
ncbi:outer membrane protein assembly factor BamD [Campylobacter pinnipediorum]|uniref:outer membrane protein assembly factor BamD n=1 Tax=Campylobacter pinnipediorum TaxID=1965231 RepID=UPI00084E0034|nr:outer membrane protein assembly factor BamD [Campylobacter pinnipediorum]